jgi:hypothetical protein
MGRGEQPIQRIDTNGSCKLVDDKLASKGKSLPEIQIYNYSNQSVKIKTLYSSWSTAHDS